MPLPQASPNLATATSSCSASASEATPGIVLCCPPSCPHSSTRLTHVGRSPEVEAHLIDIDRIRADTPAANRLAYLHNAGAALMPAPVVEAMKRHIDLESEIG